MLLRKMNVNMSSNMNEIIITSPSLNPKENVSGISSVTKFIMDNNPKVQYLHFELGKKDKEKGGWHRIGALIERFRDWKKILAEHPDAIIHYNFPLSKPSILRDPWFIRYAILHHRKMVVHVHGGLFLTAPKIPFYLMRIMRWVFGQKLPFIVLSDMERGILKERFGAKEVYSLPNCVDLRDAEAYAKDEAPLSEDRLSHSGIVGGNHQANKQPLRMGYLGRIEPNKGMTELLIACQRLKKEGFPFHLLMAGKEQTEGEYLPQFDQWLGESFEYTGLVSGQTKCDFLRSLDAFVLPSYFEGLPMSLLECMSYGKAPIVTPVGSIPQVVKDGVNGIFVKDHDVDSIKEAIKRLSDDRALLRRLGEEARKTIFSQFSPKKYIEKLNDIYLRLC